MAQKVKPREKLVFSLIGHGFFKAGVFNFLITTQSDDHISREGEEVSITRDNLKAALKPCRGDTLIISKACYSRHQEQYWAKLQIRRCRIPAQIISTTSVTTFVTSQRCMAVSVGTHIAVARFLVGFGGATRSRVGVPPGFAKPLPHTRPKGTGFRGYGYG